jgi:hypothetical protein
VMAAVRRARELGLPMDRVLALLEPVQSELRARLRAWALSEATDIPPEALITEVANAIGDRDPTGDDVRLIQRVVEQVSSDAYVDSWRGAIGVPPTTEEVGRRCPRKRCHRHGDKRSAGIHCCPRSSARLGTWQ